MESKTQVKVMVGRLVEREVVVTGVKEEDVVTEGKYIYILFSYFRSKWYHARQREKKLKMLQKAKFMSPTNVNMQKSSLDVMGEKVDVQFNSFIQRKSSEIRKILLQSPSKSVAILKHMWDQFYKSPRKHQYMHKYWKLDDKYMVKYMLKAGKHKAHKDICKLQKLVTDIKSKYKSLHQASCHTPYSWTQFQRFLSVKSVARRKLEFSRKLSPEAVSAIQEHMCSEEISFPVPDRKYAGKRFMCSMRKNASHVQFIRENE